MENIISSKTNPYGIPRALRRYIRNNPEHGEKVYQEFRKWYGKQIRAKGNWGAKVYEDFSTALEQAGLVDAALPGRKRYSVNQSHIQSRKLGGSGHTFLEYWVENQRRAADEKAGKAFINSQLMEEAGLPKNWIELFHFWDLERQGQYSSLGTLSNINPDDLIALHRGDQVNTVFQRREALDQILESAVNDPSTITQNQTAYSKLFAQSRGLNPDDPREISLRQHAGWTLDAEGNYIQKSEEEAAADFFARSTERMGGKGVNYNPLEELQSETEITGASELDPSEIELPSPQEGIAGADHTLLKGMLSLTPAGRLLTKPAETINQLRNIWDNPYIQQKYKNIQKSDFIQNFGKDSNKPSNLQKTVKPERTLNEVGIRLDKEIGKLKQSETIKLNTLYKRIIEETFGPDRLE